MKRARRLLRKGQLEQAEASYIEAVARLANYPLAMAGLTRVYLERKNGAEAVRWAEQLVKLSRVVTAISCCSAMPMRCAATAPRQSARGARPSNSEAESRASGWSSSERHRTVRAEIRDQVPNVRHD